MMYNAFSYQFVIDVSNLSERSNLPSFLKDIVKRGDLPDFQKLEEFFDNELQNASVQTQDSANYFFFIIEKALLCYFYRKDIERFNQAMDLVKHRLSAIKNVESLEINFEAWEQFLALLLEAFNRLVNRTPIEQYEQQIDNLDWTTFDKSFIPQISTIIGYVYLNESKNEQSNKARLWLQKALMETADGLNLSNQLLLSSYYMKERTGENAERIRKILESLDESANSIQQPIIQKLYRSAIFELKAHLLANIFDNFDDENTRLEHCQQELRNLEMYLQEQHRLNALPGFAHAAIEHMVGKLYAQLYHMTNDDLEQSNFAKQSVRHLGVAVDLSEENKDSLTQMRYRLVRAELAVDTNAPLTEKEAKEVIQHFKKSTDYNSYVRANRAYSLLLIRNGNSAKTYDLIQDVFKLGVKRSDRGGFYLTYQGFALANEIFLSEVNKPGVSWMVHILDDFFDRVAKVIDDLENQLEELGNSMVENFRDEFLNFEPVSHFNIKTYYRYQFYEIKLLRLGSILYNDKISLRMSDKLLDELNDENNALNFINAAWDEFKKVPNSVRNKTLNKCISISKGDLPLAAEHLDFSYRNLRSYITFKEVNRLGFFLDHQQTDNKQLEQGIRYMFYDLYKRGTIFEVVFDMPKFLVEHAKSGFYSQDLEEQLNIKGTTAKKYIKIMMEINLIRQDKTTGRKHYYRLVRENVMNRLGKDQTTLIK